MGMFTEDAVIERSDNAAAAATTTYNGHFFDTNTAPAFDSLTFIAMIGNASPGATNTPYLVQGDVTTSTTAIGSSTATCAGGDINKLVVIEAEKSVITKRYVGLVFPRTGTDSPPLDGIIVIANKPKKKPVTADTTNGAGTPLKVY